MSFWSKLFGTSATITVDYGCPYCNTAKKPRRAIRLSSLPATYSCSTCRKTFQIKKAEYGGTADRVTALNWNTGVGNEHIIFTMEDCNQCNAKLAVYGIVGGSTTKCLSCNAGTYEQRYT